MSPNEGTITLNGEGFPRVSGDEPLTLTGCLLPQPFSPRERG